jgi:hypothetical protein
MAHKVQIVVFSLKKTDISEKNRHDSYNVMKKFGSGFTGDTGMWKRADFGKILRSEGLPHGGHTRSSRAGPCSRDF